MRSAKFQVPAYRTWRLVSAAELSVENVRRPFGPSRASFDKAFADRRAATDRRARAVAQFVNPPSWEFLLNSHADPTYWRTWLLTILQHTLATVRALHALVYG